MVPVRLGLFPLSALGGGQKGKRFIALSFPAGSSDNPNQGVRLPIARVTTWPGLPITAIHYFTKHNY